MQRQSIRVLHVDDDAQFADLTAAHLESEDDRFLVDTALSASEGLGVLRDRPPDCIVSDYDMPGRSGIEFLQTVREECPEMPFILFTGKGTEEVASRAISMGVTEYLQKESGADQFTLLANRILNAVEHRTHEREREQYRTVVETAGDAMYVLDESGYIEIVNEAFERMSGYDRDAVIGEHVSEFLSPTHIEQGTAVVRSLLRSDNQESERFTVRAQRSDGESRLYETTVSLVEQNGFAGSVGIVRDITEDRRQQELLSGMFEESLHGIGVKEIVTDDSGDPVDYIYKRVNDRFEELTGLKADEVVGQRATEVIDGIEDTPFIDIFGEVALEGTTAQFEQYSPPLDRYYEVSAFSPHPGECISIFSDITERKEREEELSQYKTYVEETSDTIGVVGPDGTMKFHNQSAGGETDFMPLDVEGETGFEYVHPDDREEVMDLFTTVLEADSEQVTTELRVETADDDWRWIETRGVNKLDDPAIEGIIITSHDITERKEREQTLERYERLVEYSPELLVILAEDMTVEYQSPPSPLFEWEPKDLVGETPLEHIHPDDHGRALNHFDELSQNPDQFITSEFRIQDTNGGWEWIESRGQSLTDTDGTSRTVTAMRRVTDRKRQEQQIATYSENLEQLHRMTQTLMGATDTEEAATHVIRSFEQVFAFDIVGVWLSTADQDALEPVAISEASKQFISDPPTYSEGTQSISWEAYQEQEPRHVRDMSAHENRFNPGTPIRSEVVVPLGRHGLLNIGSTEPDDFTQQEIDLIELWADTVTVVFTQITQLERLRDRESALRRERDRLEEFASAVSHDLRNPLSVAMARAELAARECDSTHLTDAREALSRIEALIDDLLTLARQGETVGEWEPVVLEDIVSACWRNVETGEATLIVDGQATFAADQSRVTQALENLFRNAIEHGGESVTVTVGVLDDERGFYVADDGPGIPASDRDNVFDSGYTTNSDGTGFGLAIVKRICEAHTWDISVTESETGGARFEITGIDSAG